MAGARRAAPPACDISREPQRRKEKGKKTLRDRRRLSICFLSAGCQQVIALHTNDVSASVI